MMTNGWSAAEACPAPRKWLKTRAQSSLSNSPVTHLIAARVPMAVVRSPIVARLPGEAPQRASFLRRRATCLLTALVCLDVGGCALSGTEIEAITRAGAPAPSLVQTTVAAEFRTAKLTGKPQISDLHETTGPQPGDWMLCFKSDGSDQAVRYAVFFRNDKLVTARPAAIIDGCHKADYHPLEPPLPRWPGSG
jgi:hypothetical protein